MISPKAERRVAQPIRELPTQRQFQKALLPEHHQHDEPEQPAEQQLQRPADDDQNGEQQEGDQAEHRLASDRKLAPGLAQDGTEQGGIDGQTANTGSAKSLNFRDWRNRRGFLRSAGQNQLVVGQLQLRDGNGMRSSSGAGTQMSRKIAKKV
jgi:hypothetical protein